MNSFKKTTHDFGEVSPSTFSNKKSLTATFTSRYPIVSAIAECGCTSPVITDKQLEVKWDVPFLPNNLSQYNAEKKIDVIVRKGDELIPETLLIKALVKR